MGNGRGTAELRLIQAIDNMEQHESEEWTVRIRQEILEHNKNTINISFAVAAPSHSRVSNRLKDRKDQSSPAQTRDLAELLASERNEKNV